MIEYTNSPECTEPKLYELVFDISKYKHHNISQLYFVRLFHFAGIDVIMLSMKRIYIFDETMANGSRD